MLEDAEPTSEAVRAELARLTSSPAFAKSESLIKFLSFVVEETLCTPHLKVKELVVGSALYSRSTPYDPRIDSTVRVEARRLRRKLREHYQGHGRFDPVRIELPVGTYAPVFRRGVCRPALKPIEAGTSSEVTPLAIIPIRALSDEEPQRRRCDGLTDELIYAAARRSELRVVPRMVVYQFRDRSYSVPQLAEETGAECVLSGTLRDHGTTRLTIEMADAQGFVVWTERFEMPADAGLAEEERLAAEIISRLPMIWKARAEALARAA